jgi:hypothetical protein
MLLPKYVIKLVKVTFLWIWDEAKSWILVKTWIFWRGALCKLLHGISIFTFRALKKVFEDILRQCKVQKWILWKNWSHFIAKMWPKGHFFYHFDPFSWYYFPQIGIYLSTFDIFCVKLVYSQAFSLESLFERASFLKKCNFFLTLQ